MLPPIMSICLQDGYDWFHYDDDPEDLFEAIKAVRSDINDILRSPAPLQDDDDFEQSLIKTLTLVVFGSNLIEKAGSNFDITLHIAQKIFNEPKIPEDINEDDAEYAALREDLQTRGKSSDKSIVLRTHLEITQHCHAISHLIQQLVTDDKPLSEDLILETHRMLTHKIDSDDSDSHKDYSGRYRTHSVSAGLTTFSAPENVALEMRAPVADYARDLDRAADKGALDPYNLAAKYGHKFVNIHRFADGNGRTCRVIMNAILLKYAGTLVVFGRAERERDEYLSVAARGSMKQQDREPEEDDDGGMEDQAWKELSYLTLRGAKETMEGLLGRLRGSHKEVRAVLNGNGH